MAINASTTVYHVKTVYSVEDKGTKAFRAIERSAMRASSSLAGVEFASRAATRAAKLLGTKGADALDVTKAAATKVSGAFADVMKSAKLAATSFDGLGKKGARALQDVEKQATKSSNSMVDMLKKTVALAGGWMLVRSGAKGLLGFNADLEQSRITMAGIFRLNMGGTFEKQMAGATDMVSQFQQIAKASVGTTQDFVMMAQMIARPVTAAKLGMSGLRDITAGAVVAAKAFGIQAEVAALDIEQALAGQLTSKERFARALLEPLGFDTKAFNQLDQAKRAQVLQYALTQPAIAEMAKAQEGSFAGVMSTLEDSLQMTLGKIGLPLFQRLTAEAKNINAWVDANGPAIEKFGREFAGYLVDGFEAIKSVVSFVIENKDLLLTLAKGLVVYQGGKMLGRGIDAFGSGADKAGSFLKTLTSGGGVKELFGASEQAGSGLLRFTGALSRAVPIIGALATVSSGLYSLWSKRRAAEERERKDLMFKSGRSFETLSELSMARQQLRALVDTQQGRYNPALGDKAPIAGRDLTPLEEASKRQLERKVAQLSGAQQDLDVDLVKYLYEKGAFDEALKVRSDFLGKTINTLLEEQDIKPFLSAVTDLQSRLGASGIAALIGGTPAADTSEDDAKAEQDRMAALVANMAKGGTKVTINKVEVASPDPDRFVHGIARAAERFNRNPTQAQAALRGGF